MATQFDPYHKWLGIPAKHQPPNHYRLLGIDLFEPDAEVIEAAAMRHIRFLREIQDGPHVRAAKRLLNEIAVARLCLLDETRRTQYDAVIRRRIDRRRQASRPPRQTNSPADADADADADGNTLVDPPIVVRTGPPELDAGNLDAGNSDVGQPGVVNLGAGQPGAGQPGVGQPSVGNPGVGNPSAKGNRKRPRQRSASWIHWARNSWWGAAAVSGTLGGLLWVLVALWSVPADSPAEAPDAKGHGVPGTGEVSGGGTVAAQGALPGSQGLHASPAEPPQSGRPAPRATAGPLHGGLPANPARTDPARTDPTRTGTLEIPDDLFGDGFSTEVKQPSLQLDTTTTRSMAEAAGVRSTVDDQPAEGTSAVGRVAIAASGEAFKGALIREVWHCAGNQVEDVLAHVKEHPEPDLRDEVQQFAGPEDAADQYGQRLSGYLHPPVTGDYVFKIRANAEGVLLVSRDATSEHKARIESNRAVSLQAGEVYYVEAWHKESTGRDYFSVGWSLPNRVEENPIPGHRLSTQPRYRAPHETGFAVVKPLEASGSLGSVLQIEDDARIIASGSIRRDEVYCLKIQPGWSAVSGIRLQAVPHESLPAKGPGRAPGGRFSLAQVRVTAVSKSGAAPDRVVKIVSVGSDYDGPVDRLADGSFNTSWSVRNPAAETNVTLALAPPVSIDSDTILMVEIANRDSLGCFRLLATSAAEPASLPIARTPAEQPAATPADQKTRACYVNLGGADWTDADGITWIQSKPFEQQGIGHQGGRSVVADDAVSPLAGSAVRGIQAFRADVPDGRYEVSLYFCENWSRDPRRRVFSVSVEGRAALVNFNLLAVAGGPGKPFMHRLGNVVVKDGRLDVEFEPAHADAAAVLNAISFRPAR